jgi:hypothetical protein
LSQIGGLKGLDFGSTFLKGGRKKAAGAFQSLIIRGYMAKHHSKQRLAI